MDRILTLIEHYGYLVVLFGVMLESTGVPLPGETILLAAGVLVQRGHLDLGDTIAFGILGAVLGDQIGYWVGREGGRPFVLRWGRYLFITPARLGRAEAFFERHGGKAVFLARFFSGLRVFGALVAGISRMRWGTFILYNALGGAVWATAVVLVGYFLGSSIRTSWKRSCTWAFLPCGPSTFSPCIVLLGGRASLPPCSGARWASWVSACSRPELFRRSPGPRSPTSIMLLGRAPRIRRHSSSCGRRPRAYSMRCSS